MRVTSVLITLISMFLWSAPSFGVDPCFQIEGKAYSESLKLDSLEKLAGFHRKYFKCNNASVLEAYHEATSKLLDKDWGKVISSRKLEHSSYVMAVIDGVGTSWEFKRAQRIAKMARENCPKRAQKICLKIHQAEKEAQEEVKNAEKANSGQK